QLIMAVSNFFSILLVDFKTETFTCFILFFLSLFFFIILFFATLFSERFILDFLTRFSFISCFELSILASQAGKSASLKGSWLRSINVSFFNNDVRTKRGR